MGKIAMCLALALFITLLSTALACGRKAPPQLQENAAPAAMRLPFA